MPPPQIGTMSAIARNVNSPSTSLTSYSPSSSCKQTELNQQRVNAMLGANLWHDDTEQNVALEQVAVAREVTEEHETHVQVAHVEDLGDFWNDVALEERRWKKLVNVVDGVQLVTSRIF